MNSSRRYNETKPNKPVSINIYYNINSKNITNNHNQHGSQTAPISARVENNDGRTSINPKQIAQHLQKNKGKTGRLRKKKYSMDLTTINDKKQEIKNQRKSFNNSVSSGAPTFSHFKKKVEKNQRNERFTEKMRDVLAEEKQKKINKLLESYTGGQIDKKEVTKKILGIFQGMEKNRSLQQEKKMCKKKPSESTLIGTATPRNLQVMKSNYLNNPQSRYLNKARKKHTKSEKCSHTQNKSMVKADEIGGKVIEIKGIDSSLFLSDRDDEKRMIIERVDDVHTSNSVMDLKRMMREQRQSMPAPIKASPYRQLMAIRIQRAWRRYTTRKLINQLMNKSFRKSSHSFIHEMNQDTMKIGDSFGGVLMSDINISPKINKETENNLSEGLQELSNFLSQEMPQIRQVKNTQKIKGEILRSHEISKWNHILEYVQMNINNKEMNPKECLERIISYFENVKNTVEQELTIGGISTRTQNKSTDTEANEKKKKGTTLNIQSLLKKKQKKIEERDLVQENIGINYKSKEKRNVSRRDSPQITEFTNKISNRENQSQELFEKQYRDDSNSQFFVNQMDIHQHDLPERKLARMIKDSGQERVEQNENTEVIGEDIIQDYLEDNSNGYGEMNDFGDQSSQSSDLYYTAFAKIAPLEDIPFEELIEQKMSLNKYETSTPSLQRIQHSLLKHYNRIERQYEQELQNLDIHSPKYFLTKKQINKKYQQMKKELRKIIRNFNKGYQQAKIILDQQIQTVPHKQANHQSSLSECASHGSLSKCKSDNYLLKTAINYKKYMEKKEEELHGEQSESEDSLHEEKMRHSDEGVRNYDLRIRQEDRYHIEKKNGEEDFKTKSAIKRLRNENHTKIMTEDISSPSLEEQSPKISNILCKGGIRSQESEELGNSVENSSSSIVEILSLDGMVQSGLDALVQSGLSSKSSNCKPVSLKDESPNIIKLSEQAVSSMQMIHELKDEEMGEKIQELDQKQQGQIFNCMLDDNIMSAELLQYEQLNKKFEDQDQQEQEHNLQRSQEISLFENNKLNKTIRKLQCLTSEDKQDIFEFLFIDLTLQIITEYDQNTKVYESLIKEIQRRKKLSNIPRGVKTSLTASKDYISNLLHQIKDNYWQIFLKNIGVPMGPTAKQMLRYMHDQQHESDSQQDHQNESVPLILPIYIFQHHQSSLPANYPKFYDDEEKESSRMRFLKSVDHIHHKAIFDCINEWLDTQRPYGLWGVPFPWKTSLKNTQKQSFSVLKKAEKLKAAAGRAIECCSYLCGVLVDKQESVFGSHKVSEHYVQQIREDRMCKMLSNELYQNQDRWYFVDDQETQVVIEISKIITKIMIEEASLEILKVAKILDF